MGLYVNSIEAYPFFSKQCNIYIINSSSDTIVGKIFYLLKNKHKTSIFHLREGSKNMLWVNCNSRVLIKYRGKTISRTIIQRKQQIHLK